jgi:tetratricopeptide (TPR) repeat protein
MSVEPTNCERIALSVPLAPESTASELDSHISALEPTQSDAVTSSRCVNSALWQSGRLNELRRHLLAELIQAETSSDRQELLDVTNDLACVYRALGDAESAAHFQTQAAAREMEIRGPGQLTATALSNLACDALLAGELPTAEGLFWKSLLSELAAGNHAGAAADWANLGLLAGLQGDHEESRYRLWEALKLHRRAGDSHGMAMDLWHLGQSFEESGNWPRCAKLYQRAEQLFLRLGNDEFRIESRDRKELAKARLQVTQFDACRN